MNKYDQGLLFFGIGLGIVVPIALLIAMGMGAWALKTTSDRKNGYSAQIVAINEESKKVNLEIESKKALKELAAALPNLKPRSDFSRLFLAMESIGYDKSVIEKDIGYDVAAPFPMQSFQAEKITINFKSRYKTVSDYIYAIESSNPLLFLANTEIFPSAAQAMQTGRSGAAQRQDRYLNVKLTYALLKAPEGGKR